MPKIQDRPTIDQFDKITTGRSHEIDARSLPTNRDTRHTRHSIEDSYQRLSKITVGGNFLQRNKHRTGWIRNTSRRTTTRITLDMHPG